MAYKLNKKTKTHIADMATREKYKSLFDKKMASFVTDLTKQAYSHYQNELFEGVNPVVLKACSCTNSFDLYSDRIDIESISAALQYGSEKIEKLTLDRGIYGAGYRVFPGAIDDKHLYRDLLAFIKEVASFHSALMEAMQPFKSAEKMLKALPWAEKYYPEEDKTPTCNIVPISIIEKANELMGVAP